MFKSPILQLNGHLQTIIPSFFRKITVPYVRERVELPDGDFIDVDWLIKEEKGRPLLIVTHGLEGDSTRHYVTGLAKLFFDNGYNVCAWNCRSCSGELNRLERFYHHGDAADLNYLINRESENYKEIFIAGYSMGGSLTLRSIAENPDAVPENVKGAMAVSVPLDLTASVYELYKKGKRFYMNRFLRKLKIKIEEKSKLFPENRILQIENFKSEIKNFHDFDGRITAPLHGYKDAKDFYLKASVKPLLPNIKVPALVLQAKNDPFLCVECLELGTDNEKVKLEITENGGHVGFQQTGNEHSYAELRALKFFNAIRQKA